MRHRQSPLEAPSTARWLIDRWAAIAAALFILLIVFGVLPRLPW
jgi:hypothetical protein